ncbi:hypothetical protein F511_26006 [Dorcoceras hygrometricum]|uniref:Uncharacterized protein n=1 Tax=Dorcoceras hygrometricum TaxID=472368 RepID=A0A2Z7DHC1_9LAMI|nr:hypothetical protein F511_26006 [Dorcoceras hygrometricum]
MVVQGWPNGGPWSCGRWLDTLVKPRAPHGCLRRAPPSRGSTALVQPRLGSWLGLGDRPDLGVVQPIEHAGPLGSLGLNDAGDTADDFVPLASPVRLSWYQSGGSGGVLACCVKLGSHTEFSQGIPRLSVLVHICYKLTGTLYPPPGAPPAGSKPRAAEKPGKPESTYRQQYTSPRRTSGSNPSTESNTNSIRKAIDKYANAMLGIKATTESREPKDINNSSTARSDQRKETVATGYTEHMGATHSSPVQHLMMTWTGPTGPGPTGEHSVQPHHRDFIVTPIADQIGPIDSVSKTECYDLKNHFSEPQCKMTVLPLNSGKPRFDPC